MTEKDVVVPAAYRVPDGNVSLPKPWHLVGIHNTNKVFLATERPVMEPSHIQAKGFWITMSDDAVVKDWQNISRNMLENKKNMVEEYIPWQHVTHIRNLAYVAK